MPVRRGEREEREKFLVLSLILYCLPNNAEITEYKEKQIEDKIPFLDVAAQ